MQHRDSRVYLDHNATSPIRASAVQAVTEALEAGLGNPSSQHAEGRRARALLERSRESVARLAGCRPGEVVFTSGGSEALSSAVRGVCDRAPGDRKRILVSEVEHSAVLESARLAAGRGFVVVRIPCGRDGRIDADRFRLQLGPDVALAAVQWANNETGVVQPLEGLGRACRQAGIPFLIDAVQAAGKVALDPKSVFADLMAISGHKLGGPQGTGALIVRSGIALVPLVAGGAQEMRRRGGTESVAALAGFGAAAREAHDSLAGEGPRLLRLRAQIETRLLSLFPEIRFHGQEARRLSNTVNFGLPGVPGETLAIALDLAGYAVSTGSACASGAVEPSHVIQAMGYDEEEARRAVRVSLGWSSRTEDVRCFLDTMPDVVAGVREGLGRDA